MESAKHRGCVWSTQVRVTDGGLGAWFVQRGVGAVETLRRVAESAGQPLTVLRPPSL